LDTSRVLDAGRSRDLVVISGALAGQKLEALLTKGTGGQKAKRCAVARFLTVPRIRLADFTVCKLLNTTEGVLGPPVVRPLRAWRYGVL
jgi:hypothetical protein